MMKSENFLGHLWRLLCCATKLQEMASPLQTKREREKEGDGGIGKKRRGGGGWALGVNHSPHLEGQGVGDFAPGVGQHMGLPLEAPVHALDGLLPAAIAVRIHEPTRQHCHRLKCTLSSQIKTIALVIV